MSFLSDFKVALLGNCVVLYVSITTNYKTGSKYYCNEKLRYRSRGSCVLDFTMWLFCYPFLTIPFLVNFYTFKKSDVHSLFRQVDPRVINS